MKLKLLLVAALAFCLNTAFAAWPLWDEFKACNLTEEGRVVDYSDAKLITTSEGQSYGMFFSLVANDRESFDKILDWTEKNLGEDQPAWLWGIPDGKDGHPGKVLDTNNATDSDMWIAYCLLEASRLWNAPQYAEKAKNYIAKLKELVREIPTIGKVLLPGRVGFEEKGVITLNPSYYPLFILRRFAEEDPSWLPILQGLVTAMVRSSPTGIAPDWAKFDPEGKLVDQDKMQGSWNAIRTYLWAGIMSPRDPIYGRIKNQFTPMIALLKIVNIPPEQINIGTLTANDFDVNAFGACFLPYVSRDKSGGLIRTILTRTKMQKENYYRNCLTMFGLGFDYKQYAFDERGRFFRPKDNLEVSSMTTEKKN
ncbi:MAG: cellulase [Burkholderiales bacterium]|nr:cellulase [Burkholderiales bacterium]